MIRIPESHRDLLKAPLTCSFCTVGADGTPQVTGMWYLADEDTVKISMPDSRQKVRNLARNPRATVFIIDPDDHFRTLEIRGTTHSYRDDELRDYNTIIRHYGHDPATFAAPIANRIIVTLSPTRVVVQGAGR